MKVIHEGRPIAFEEEATPASVILQSEIGSVEICIDEEKVVRIRSNGVGFRLHRQQPEDGGYHADYPFIAGHNRIQVNAFRSKQQYMLSVIRGNYRIDAPWEEVTCPIFNLDFEPDGHSGTAELAIESFLSVWMERSYDRPFDDCLKFAEASFERWMALTTKEDAGYPAVRELAAFVQYAPIVEPAGKLGRAAMLISPGFNGIWSWDHAFNAMSLIYNQPQMAWDQLMLPFDQQDEFGALPDYYNDTDIVWNYTKPPIHGWALRFMLERSNAITNDQLRCFYPKLVRWTNWWFTYRDYDGNGIPQYNHGNDSGWDNSLIFANPGIVESPDLSAFLVVQMDVLAEVARRLGLMEEAEAWEHRSDRFLARMMDYFWAGDRFIAKRGGTAELIDTQSLLHWIPIVLGSRLPEELIRVMADKLGPEGPFLTEWGLATEQPASPHYQPDGYWRGPIWAPSTFIIAEGLRAAGERELAQEIARRFCRLCANGGMSENYDALTGQGLRDRSHTWPASVFLIFAHEFVNMEGV